MRIAFLGNFQPDLPPGVQPWSTETHLAASFELAGHTVTRIQEGDVSATDVPALAAGHGLFVWVQTYGLAEKGGTNDERLAMVDQLRSAGIPTVGLHLDRWWGLAREEQVAREAFFRCLPAESRVSAGSVVNVTRRWYSGELVRVRTGEHEVAATPNHPVLTDRGWVPIGELRVGDHVIERRVRERASLGDPQVVDGPPTVEEVFEAASHAPVPFAVRRQRIRAFGMDFHGDGTDGYVDVVWPFDGLGNNLKISSSQPVGDLLLLLSEAGQVHRTEPNPEMVMVSLAGELVSLGLGPELNTRIGENALDGSATAARVPVGSSQGFHRLARQEPATHVSGDDRTPGGGFPLAATNGTGPHFNADPQEPLTHAAERERMDVGQLLQRHAGLVSFAQVVDVRREQFAGHVYNLQTAEGAYLANGIVTHNCDLVCTADGGNDDRWAAAGVTHAWMPPGVFGPECRPGQLRPEWECDVAFVGSWRGYHAEHAHRPEMLRFLRQRYGGRFRIFPAGEAIRGRDLADLYASVNVVVGDSCLVGAPGFTGLYYSDRIPETIGRGGFLLHPRVKGVTDGEQFINGEHLACWEAGNWERLDALIGRYLEDAEERARIAESGRRYVLRFHTYSVRVRQVLATLVNRGLLDRGLLWTGESEGLVPEALPEVVQDRRS